MSWFYATKDKQQVGPVEEAALAGLFRSGTITSETLVWTSGMEGWKPYAAVFPAPLPTAPVTEAGLCSECGQPFPPEQLISLAGRVVCAACKPVAVQKLQEGVLAFGSPANPEELWNKVQQRGFNFTIRSVFARSWQTLKPNFWPAFGITLLAYLIIMAASQIPIAGLLATFFVQPQMIAGLGWYFIKLFRGQPATINDSFAGFRRGFGQQALYMLIVSLIIFGVIFVLAVPAAIAIPAISKSAGEGTSTTLFVIFGVILVPILLGIWYLMICWSFASLLILDKGLGATAAMKLSRRVIQLRFWKVFGLFLLMGLLSLLGLLALVIGLLFVLPFCAALYVRIYEDAFGEEGPVVTTT